MGLHKKLKAKLAAPMRIVNTTPPGSNINKFYDPLEYLDKQSFSKDYQAYYNQSFSINSISPSQNYGGTISPNVGGMIPGGSMSPVYGSVNELYSDGWQATRQPCPNCGAGMLSNVKMLQYWCTTCCQKFTKEAVESRSRAQTALEWLDKQISRYTRK